MRSSPQLRSHGNNVFEALNAAINSLDKLESLNGLLLDLGTRHRTYGAQLEHFQPVADALIETIGEALGSYFTSEHLNAWGKIAGYLATQMAKGMSV